MSAEGAVGESNTILYWEDDSVAGTVAFRPLPIEDRDDGLVTIWAPRNETYAVVDNRDGTGSLVYG